jgi:hypothetical protein
MVILPEHVGYKFYKCEKENKNTFTYRVHIGTSKYRYKQCAVCIHSGIFLIGTHVDRERSLLRRLILANQTCVYFAYLIVEINSTILGFGCCFIRGSCCGHDEVSIPKFLRDGYLNKMK